VMPFGGDVPLTGSSLAESSELARMRIMRRLRHRWGAVFFNVAVTDGPAMPI
jgi:hypothetical protein